MPLRGQMTGGNDGQTTTNASTVLTFPAGTAVGDVGIIVTAQNTTAAGTVNTPTGWTLLAGPVDQSTNTRSYLFGKVLDSSDVAAGSVTVTAQFPIRWVAVGQVRSGVSGFAQVASSVASGTVATATPPTVTTTADGREIVSTVAYRRASSPIGTATWPAGWTEGSEATTAFSSGAQCGASFATLDTPGPAGTYGGANVNLSQSEVWVAFTLALTPAAVTPRAGSASGTLSWAGMASGSTTRRGSASGSLAWAGTASGGTQRRGSATGALVWTGTASGTTPRRGSASGSLAWAGAAAGRTERRGSGSGSLAWTGTASGSAPAVGGRSGSASGSLAWTGAASGSTTRRGSASGLLAWAGSATGRRATRGSAAGELAWLGSATGHTDRSGSAAGDLSWVGTASGSARERRDLSGSAVLLVARARASLTHTDRALVTVGRDRGLVTLAEED